MAYKMTTNKRKIIQIIYQKVCFYYSYILFCVWFTVTLPRLSTAVVFSITNNISYLYLFQAIINNISIFEIVLKNLIKI